MCEWGDTVTLEVPIPGDLSHTGEDRWDHKPVDRCIAPIVEALNDHGIYTRTCCCGHGKGAGGIVLWDGRSLRVGDWSAVGICDADPGPPEMEYFEKAEMV